MNGRSRGSMMAAGPGVRSIKHYPHSPTTPKEGPSPSPTPSRNTLSPGEQPLLARPRRLSAPCGPAGPAAASAPSSPAHRPSRAASPCGFQRSEVGLNGSHSSRMSSDAWVCPNDRQLALRAK